MFEHLYVLKWVGWLHGSSFELIGVGLPRIYENQKLLRMFHRK